MKHNWEYKNFGSLCNIVRGGSPRPIQDYLTDATDGLNWIKIGDVAAGSKYITSTKERIKKEGLVKTRQVFKGDFILSNSMSFGRPYILKIDGCIHDGWLAIKGVENHFIADFLYYYLSSPSTYLLFEKLVKGGVVSNLNSDIVKGIDVPVPPMEVQQKIVAELDKINEVIEDCRELLRNLDALAKSLFYDYFGDPNSITKNSKKHLGELAINYDSRRKPVTKKDRVAGIYPYYGASGIVDYVSNYIFNGSFLLISEDGANLLSRTQPIAFISTGKVWINNHAHVIDFDEPYTKVYAMYYLNLLDFREKITGAAQPKLTQKALNEIQISWPPLELQEQFAERIEQIEAQKKTVEEKRLQTCKRSSTAAWTIGLTKTLRLWQNKITDLHL